MDGSKVGRGNLERGATWNEFFFWLVRPEQKLLEKLCGILYGGKSLHLLTMGCRARGSSSLGSSSKRFLSGTKL